MWVLICSVCCAKENFVTSLVYFLQIPIGIAAFVVTAIIASLIFLWYKNRV